MEFPVRCILAFLKELGLEGVGFLHQENSILDVLNTVGSRRFAGSKVEPLDEEDHPDPGANFEDCAGVKSWSSEQQIKSQGRSIPEPPPVDSSWSSGFVERAIQVVEGQARTIKLAFESHTGATVLSDHNIAP